MDVEPVTGTIRIEVVHARPGKQVLRALDVPVGATVADAIDRSGIREAFPDLVVQNDGVGVFSRKVTLDYELQAGDRVEIYRPLIADPKESRRRRAEKDAAG